MSEQNDFDLTSGEGSMLIEIDAEFVPITPEILRRLRLRRFYRPLSDGSDPFPPEVPPADTDKPE